MSLRGQIFLSVVASLLAAILAQAIIAGWQARLSVENEMHRAMEAGTQSVSNALLSLPPSDADSYVSRLTRSFDGNRHIKVAFIRAGTTVSTSNLAPAEAAPHWFTDLLQIPSEHWSAHPSRDRLITVSTDPQNEIAETWGQFRDGSLVLVLFDGLVLGLLHIILGRTAEPLQKLKSGFKSLGGGNYRTRVVPAGASELKTLGAEFNKMAERLARLEAANTRLVTQLTEIQEEERADLARDLHDEMGPFLFAVRLDASRIETEAAEIPAAVQRARSISDAVSHMQHHVSAILKELRPEGFREPNLAAAIENLVSFWNKYDPNIAISLDLGPAHKGFADEIDMTVFRIVQEGLTNVVRHGHATSARVCIILENNHAVITVDDNGKGLAGDMREGRGIRGMRERLMALGGTLRVEPTPGGGTGLKAVIPLTPHDALADA